MSPHQWRSWKQFFRQNIGSKRRAERRRLIVEQLECRLAPAIVANDDSYVMVQDTALHLPGGQQFLAQAGFNDAKGINSNPFPDSPYRLGDTIHRRGIKEPGWAAGWVRQVPRCGGLRHAQNLHQVPHAHLSSLEQT